MFRRMIRGALRRFQSLTPEQRAAQEALELGNAVRAASPELFESAWQEVERFLARDVPSVLKVHLLEFVLDRNDLTPELRHEIKRHYEAFTILEDASAMIASLEQYLREQGNA